MKRTPPALVPQACQPGSIKTQRQRIFFTYGDRKKKYSGYPAWMSPKKPAETGFMVQSKNNPAPYKQTSPFYLKFVTKATLWDRGVYHYTHRNHHEIPTAPCPRYIAHMSSPDALQYTRTLSKKSAHLKEAYEKPNNKTTSKWVMSGSGIPAFHSTAQATRRKKRITDSQLPRAGICNTSSSSS
ncbi:hypothetical protein XENTR_v10008420 [Xenopus tropicalis]|nr:hypothetical protein XENTR_v10008420 [Xenopus tropicalis]